MAEYTEEGICLWDGESRGTQHMMKQMNKFNKPFEMKTIKLVPDPPEPTGLEKFFDE
jgi:hypothetical protein